LPDARQFSNKPDIEQIIDKVKQVITEDSALIKRVQIYLCHRYSGQKLKGIGLYFGIGQSGVSQASRRVKIQIYKDKKLKKQIDGIVQEMNLSRV
jgi:putative transposase